MFFQQHFSLQPPGNFDEPSLVEGAAGGPGVPFDSEIVLLLGREAVGGCVIIAAPPYIVKNQPQYGCSSGYISRGLAPFSGAVRRLKYLSEKKGHLGGPPFCPLTQTLAIDG